MAKGKSGRSGTRDALQSLTVTTLRSPQRAVRLQEVDDRRTFDFEPGTRPARLFSGVTAATTVTTPSKKQQARGHRVPYQIAFKAPAATLVCVRRARRKEVLFAKKKAGKRGQKRPRWSAWSKTACR